MFLIIFTSDNSENPKCIKSSFTNGCTVANIIREIILLKFNIDENYCYVLLTEIPTKID